MIDLTLPKAADGTYSLGAPTEDPSTRVANRFIVQFLSTTKETGRGSLFETTFRRGQLTTNAAVVGQFSLAALGLQVFFVKEALTAYPTAITLKQLSISTLKELSLTVVVSTKLGSVSVPLTVSTT